MAGSGRTPRPGGVRARKPRFSACAAAMLAWTLVVVGAAQGPTPPAPAPSQGQRGPHGASAPIFAAGENCLACHNGIVTTAGEDVSIGRAWRASMMANSARDPYWQAALRREVLDHPSHGAAIQHECARCHMPMAQVQAHAAGRRLEVLRELPRLGAATGGPGPTAYPADLAADGVSCTLCHQIDGTGLGRPESFNGGFTIGLPPASGEAAIVGPFEIDAGRATIMRSATGFAPQRGGHLQASEMCATCHTLYTEALGSDGRIVGRLPEQMPYLEWRHSAYREARSCQSCHMPEVEGRVPVASVLGEPREGVSRHAFPGGNAFVLRMFARYREALGVRASRAELEAAAVATERQLAGETARIHIEAVAAGPERLAFDVRVENRAGHKLPTGYPSRRVWIHVRVRDGRDRIVFESGAFEPTGAITGNDADADGGRVEPHYETIRRAGEVQIYESAMVDPEGRVTTGLLIGVRYVKDNRLLPTGFDPGSASGDIAVRGGASADRDFTGGGDRVRYELEVEPDAPRPLHVEATLYYQPIAYRWAQNLRSYDASEPRRFVDMYDSMAATSAARLATAAHVVNPGTPAAGATGR